MAGIAKPFSPEAALKRSLRAHLRQLGFTKDEAGELVLPGVGKDMIRRMHRGQRRERLAAAQPFLARALERALPSFADGAEIDPAKIRLRLRLIKSGTPESDLFRVATLTWSVPVSAGFGRRMRYLVWDEVHDRLAGVIALGDPVYNLSVRDSLIGWNVEDRAKRLVGILDAYVLGAVPPYNFLLGGKAIACLIRSRDVYDDFRRLYGQSVGVISRQAKQAHLVAVTTTSSMGRSSVYNRLRLEGTSYFERIGFTEGWGHFHITDTLFLRMRDFLRDRDHRYADMHKFGEGPNWRLRTIRAALSALDFDENILRHGIKREVFISKLAANAYDVLRTDAHSPDIAQLLTVAEISDLARNRWMIPRADRGEVDYRSWRRDKIPLLIKGRLETGRIADRSSG
ncbi:MAG: hypothetical protein CVT80_00045 [Alphaproteobacteria bacterium HGW-Alphaproteobacteria-2]|nr:MAG: hypothetical protein CVT80_00045 [Alphaproteobacteria bacterium HGW-Alphaproteobacteria-2]